MKKVYFVRHGESEGNVGPIRQEAHTPLTEKGREQAAYVAERCSRLPAEVIISSTMVRARETTDAILKKLDKPVEYSDLFVERRRAKEIYGKPKDDPTSVRIDKMIWDRFSEPGFRFSDEENFDDLKARAKNILAHLHERPEKNILVVTHGLILRIVMAYIVFGEGLTAAQCQQFIRKFHMENTGLTVIAEDEKFIEKGWWLWIWNDHAHLG